MRYAALAIALTACGRIGFDAIGGDAGGSNGSSGSNNAPGDGALGCVSPGIGDSFDEVMPCKAWGIPIADNAGLSTSNGTLTITLQPNVMASGGCENDAVTFGPDGVFVQIGNVPSIGSLRLNVEIAGPATWAMEVMNENRIDLIQPGDLSSPQTPYEPWWRMRPLGGVVVWETSPDGLTWTIQRTGDMPAPSSALISIVAFANDPAPGQAVLDGIDVCP
jgi:hypothetical protein